MLTEVRAKSQITIPKKILDSMKINVGDFVDIVENDGVICIIPVAVYPRDYVENLHQEVNKIKANIINGKKSVFKNVDDMFAELEA